MAVYSNGGRHCFSTGCDYHVNGETGDETEVSTPSNLNMGGVVAEITDRRLSAKTTRHYQVTVEYDANGKIARHYYPYYDVLLSEHLVDSHSVQFTFSDRDVLTSATALLLTKQTCVSHRT